MSEEIDMNRTCSVPGCDKPALAVARRHLCWQSHLHGPKPIAWCDEHYGERLLDFGRHIINELRSDPANFKEPP